MEISVRASNTKITVFIISFGKKLHSYYDPLVYGNLNYLIVLVMIILSFCFRFIQKKLGGP